MYIELKSFGSLGGKIVGAGGGGFFLMVDEKNKNEFTRIKRKKFRRFKSNF